MSVRMRQEIERKIAIALINAAIKAGYKISVNNGGEDNEIEPTTDAAKVLKAMFATDDEYLLFFKGSAKQHFAWAWFVYGNDGYDVISDYTTNIEHLMPEPNLIADYYDADGPWVSFEDFKAQKELVSTK
jgi:hypothetical protein